MAEFNFETALDQLQKTVKALEGGELPLEQSLKYFEEGVSLARQCQEYLTAAQRRIETFSAVAERTPSPPGPVAP